MICAIPEPIRTMRKAFSFLNSIYSFFLIFLLNLSICFDATHVYIIYYMSARVRVCMWMFFCLCLHPLPVRFDSLPFILDLYHHWKNIKSLNIRFYVGFIYTLIYTKLELNTYIPQTHTPPHSYAMWQRKVHFPFSIAFHLCAYEFHYKFTSIDIWISLCSVFML